MALTDNLVSLWRFDETAGNAADAVGGNRLTNNNSATYVAGKLFNGTDLESGSSQYFSITDAAQTGLDITSDLTFSTWIKRESAGTQQYIISKQDAGSARAYAMYVDGSDNLATVINEAADGSDQSQSVHSTTLSAGSWFHVVAVYTASTGTVLLYVNGSSAGSTANSTNATAINDNSGSFRIGAINTGVTLPFDGILDEVCIWNRPLSSGEVTELYNSGNGVYYLDGEFTSSANALNNKLVSYWKTDESSGGSGPVTRVDSQGPNDLTDAGTTASATGIINNGADFVAADTTSLSITDANQTGLDIAGDIGFSFWIKHASLPGSGTNDNYFQKWGSGDNAYRVNLDNPSGTHRLEFGVQDSGGGEEMTVNWTPSTGTWYHVVITWDASASTTYFYVSQSTFGDIFNTTQVGAITDIRDSARTFAVGASSGGGDGIDGVMDEVGVWNRLLTAGEAEELFDSGSGFAYPFSAVTTLEPSVNDTGTIVENYQASIFTTYQIGSDPNVTGPFKTGIRIK